MSSTAIDITALVLSLVTGCIIITLGCLLMRARAGAREARARAREARARLASERVGRRGPGWTRARLRDVPHVSGVYRIRTDPTAPYFVGCSEDVRHRLTTYTRAYPAGSEAFRRSMTRRLRLDDEVEYMFIPGGVFSYRAVESYWQGQPNHSGSRFRPIVPPSWSDDDGWDSGFINEEEDANLLDDHWEPNKDILFERILQRKLQADTRAANCKPDSV